MTEELEWLKRTKRRNALRVLVAGVVFAIAGVVWLIANRDFSTSGTVPTDNTHTEYIHYQTGFDPRLIGGMIGAVGALLVLAGVVLLSRANKLD